MIKKAKNTIEQVIFSSFFSPNNVFCLFNTKSFLMTFNSVIQFNKLNWTEQSQNFEHWMLNIKFHENYSVQFTVNKR